MRKVVIGPATLYRADCRDVLPTLGKVDAVVTDPPYSSGGLMRSDRAADTYSKYSFTGTRKTYATFCGDNRDQRSFMFWSSDWMAQALDVTRMGGAMLCFIDWRNLPCLIDATQIGGWVYRGIVPWDKTEACRPNKGWFRSQTEYIVTASAGPLKCGPKTPYKTKPGVLRFRVAHDKQHQTEKPIPLLAELLSLRRDWRTVLDPFMGSGTTGVAAVQLGRRFIGIEKDAKYFDIAVKRIREAHRALISTH